MRSEKTPRTNPFRDLESFLLLIAIHCQKKCIAQLFGPETGVGGKRGHRVGRPVVEIGNPQKFVVEIGGRSRRHCVKRGVETMNLEKTERPFPSSRASHVQQLFSLVKIALPVLYNGCQVTIEVGIAAFGKFRGFQQRKRAAQEGFSFGDPASAYQPFCGQKVKRRGYPSRPNAVRSPGLNGVNRKCRLRIAAENAGAGQLSQGLFNFRHIAIRKRGNRSFEVGICRLKNLAVLKIDITQGDECVGGEEMVIFTFHQKRFAKAVDGFFMFSGPFQTKSEHDVQKRA